jgi:NDP-sugar pyrophosphorylase family protein
MKEIENLKKEIEKTQIIIMAGGSAKRMGLAFQDIPKPMIEIGGKPLIEWCIELYKNCGFRDFVFILGYKHEKIEEYIKDGSKFGINAKYCIDPEENMGKGKSLKAALKNFDVNRRSIISYPDDLFLDKTLPIRLLLHHLDGKKRLDIIATNLFVSATRYPFGVGEINDKGIVESFIEKPIIQKFSSTGTIVVEPEFFNMIKKYIDEKSEKPIEFESVVYPIIAEMKKMYSMVVSPDVWLPINTLKELEKAKEILEKNNK